MYWDQLTSAKLGALDKRTPVILPIAATEQHGPHLPLATDRMIADHFAKRLHEELSDGVLILPTVAVGCSEHHMDFAGSLTVTHITFIQYVSELLDAASAHGFTNLVLFNAHGGNVAAGQVIAESFGKRHPSCRVVMMTWWSIAADALRQITETGPGGVGHACEFETSLILRIAPHLVERDLIENSPPQPTFDWATGDMLRGSRAALYRTFKQSTTNGAYGDPTAASAEKGQHIETAVVEQMRAIILSLTAE